MHVEWNFGIIVVKDTCSLKQLVEKNELSIDVTYVCPISYVLIQAILTALE